MPKTIKGPILLAGFILLSLSACSILPSTDQPNPDPSQTELANLPTGTTDLSTPALTETENTNNEDQEIIEAVVVSIAVSGSPDQYQFQVGISSPDIGCEQYADWWEVLSEDGDLLYRRILTHSHVNEQPFVRSGGPVQIGSSSSVIIRAHMNEAGYSSQGMIGSVDSGFEPIQLPAGFGSELESQPPLPTGCNF